MGEIRKEVWDNHLNNHPQEVDILKPFLNGFYITWGASRKAFNTTLSTYILNPEDFMKEAYGFTHEILLVYSPYDRMETRTLQAADSFFNEVPVKGRVETLNFFLVSEQSDVVEWINTYVNQNQETKMIVAFSADDLRNAKSDGYFIRRALNEQFFSRDLFDYRLPLVEDTYFFGRTTFIGEYFDSIKRGENKGIFGLRKTGKTSILFKLGRLIEREGIGKLFIYDCKSPSIRKLRWFQLLEVIIENICKSFNIKLIEPQYDEVHIANTFMKLLDVVEENKKIVIAFDEIEYISFIAKLDGHWKNDFIDFWQTIWSCQSLKRKFTVIIAGVSPIVVEQDTINEVQNPLFGIVSYKFLNGFELEEMKEMIKKLGKKMGLNFSYDALEYIHKRYGGHPLLTRLAISYENKVHLKSKPASINVSELIVTEDLRDAELTFYCRHAVSELRQFYPDEYDMIELLACGNISDFLELSLYKEFTRHLQSYGLLEYDNNKRPVISIPVIGRYVALELAIREGRKTILKVVDTKCREKWLQRRKTAISKDLRFLEKIINKNSTLPKLFGPNSFPEADKFMEIPVCCYEKDFRVFINTLNRCFVESIELYGKSIGRANYFWKEIKTTYDALFDSLNRIKVYRNDNMHLELNDNVDKTLKEYLDRDLEKQRPSEVQDLYFVLQQCTLDAVLNAIQIEINTQM